MAEYIEREALLRYLNDIWLSAMPNDFMPDDDRQLAIVRCMGLNDAMDAIKSIPAADVRPVVLCRDCIFRSNEWTGCPKLNGTITGDEFFCKCGVKKKEES